MIRNDLEAAGIPYTTKDGDADFHAAGRHTYITELLRNGTSLVAARELARHSDVTMTMRYTHIGLKDQAKGIENLPTDPKWLETCHPTEPLSQHICSKSGVSEGHAESPESSECHSKGETEYHASADAEPSYYTHRQKKAPSVTDGAQVEAAGIDPRAQSRNSQVTQRLWNVLQDVGVSWEWTDDANRQSMALGPEELAEVITAWLLLSADLRQAILAIVRSANP